LALLGILVGVVRFGLAQEKKHQSVLHTQLIARLDANEEANKEHAAQRLQMEREMLQLKADLPLQYVRRDDYIRGQSVIESKLDALASKLEVAQLRALNGGNNAS